MRKLRRLSALRVKLGVIAVILIAIPFLLISITYTRSVKEIIKNKYTQTALQSVYEAGEQIDLILRDIQEFSTVIISNSTLLSMAENPSAYSDDAFQDVLRSFMLSRDDIEVIDLIIDDTRYSIGANKIDVDMTIHPDLSRSAGQPVWLATKSSDIEILSGKFHKNYFTLSRKIINYNTLDDLGYLLMDLEEMILEQAYKSLQDNQNEEIYICDEYGTVISHADKKKIGSTIKFKPYAGSVLNSQELNGYILYTEDVDEVAIYATIQSNWWRIVKTIPTSYLYEEINDIQRNFVVGGIIYGLAIILFMIFFSVRYTEPMMKMMNVIKKAEQGDLTVRTEVSTNDEVGQLGASLNNMIAEMQNLIDRLVKEEQEKKEVELEALHAQINPHFLYNTLNTIKWMAKIQGNNSVSRAIVALVKLLRVSTNLGRDMITLKEEIEYVNNYIVIQKLKYNEAINMTYDIDDTCMDVMMPKLILQPIVENAIIYGISDEHKDINIVIKSFKKESEMFIEITDDGPGMGSEIVEEILKYKSDKNRFSKVGLNNINQRIKLYYGDDYGLRIETSKGMGTKIIVNIPDQAGSES